MEPDDAPVAAGASGAAGAFAGAAGAFAGAAGAGAGAAGAARRRRLDGMPPLNCDQLDDDCAGRPDEIGDMTFCMNSYIAEAMKMMFMMRSHHMLTDVILEVGTELFHAHKIVLASASPYFKAMFTGGLKECEMSRVKLQGVSPSAMAWLVYFMYTGKVRITELTVCRLLPAATMFQIGNVIDACCAFLERQLDPTNAIGIANFADQHGCANLKLQASQYIERQFSLVCQQEEFLQLTAAEVIALIKKDELNVREEQEVYNAVVSWVKHDEDKRACRMERILQAVRCQLLTPTFLQEQMANCALLRKVPPCREYLARVFQDLTLHKRPPVRERRPNTPCVVYLMGGYLRHSIDTFEVYSPHDDRWTSLPRLAVPRSGLGAAFLKGMLYAVGGRNNSAGSSYDSDWMDMYDPKTREWEPCSPMSVARNRVGVAVMDGLLYAVGGSAALDYHKSVEIYNPETNAWRPAASMRHARLGVGVAVVNRLLYAVGGYGGEGRLTSVECYHPENDRWTEVAPMSTPRSGAGVAAINQHIYAVGGYDGERQLRTVERYDTERDEWQPVAPLGVPRSALSLSAIDNKLYAMGGYDGQIFLNLVEIYDPATDRWTLGTPLTSDRSGHASAVSYLHVPSPYDPPPEPRPRKRPPVPAPAPGPPDSVEGAEPGEVGGAAGS